MSKNFNSSQISFPEKRRCKYSFRINVVRSITPLRIEKKSKLNGSTNTHFTSISKIKNSYVAKHMSYLHDTYVVVFADNNNFLCINQNALVTL